ncbi:6,7-dimethyl-8-ribityllumazine synthase [Mariniblastus fucicola]|uniref:6,7-dimethyl-8-ribityllumazine synthase n=1 Tax=Mariniblastus fucicola TaxID=980251 RepID=A0A5B9PD73_9BACT|nr:6,7-dimethyl-8-ribityllumazine synthase [Mariniblastus fucicola]QEG24264.1 6,7-dimethyl-8-ribityllumazine synthase [Mariniblastus fucicola]
MTIDKNQRELGKPSLVTGSRVGIVVSSYHRDITGKLHSGAVETLKSVGIADEDIFTAWVPGSWEIPLAAQRLLDTDKWDAIVCLGCVIRGETTHDQHINTTISNALGMLSLDYSKPVAFGVLTCNTLDQALARSGGSVGNKGVEAAESVLHMLSLFEEIGS